MGSQSTTVAAPGGQIVNWFKSVKDYIGELRAEMRRVTWPSRVQVQATTAVVIISVFLFAAYFALVDALLGSTINKIFHALATR
ncbi:MAG: preprotein translocase subunit SecE [Bryobacteraceae bacterium]|jgi:preprotein translocase subunit SecE